MIAPLVIIIIWAIASALLDLHKFLLPDIFGVWRELISNFTSGEIPFHVSVTFFRVFVGVVGASLLGIPLGAMLARNSNFRKHCLPTVEFLRGIPTSLLFPLFIIFFGVGEVSKVMISLYLAVPIFAVNTMVGLMPRQETQGRRDYMELHRRHIPYREYIFAAMWDGLPSIAASFKLSVSLGLVVVIVTEMFFISSSGVGWAAFRAYQNLDMDKMFLYIIIVGLIAACSNAGLDKLIKSARLRSGDISHN